MSSLSSTEKSFIESFIDYGVEKFGFDTGRSLPITLVFLGERDGCLVGVSDADDADFVRGLLSDCNIPYAEDDKNSGFYIAKSSSHLSRHNPLGSATDTGEFFGYPADAIEFYENDSKQLITFEAYLTDETSMSIEEWADKVFLIEYIPAPTAVSVEQALERQEQYEQALRSVSVDLSQSHNRSL